jgi:hypothetical protein
VHTRKSLERRDNLDCAASAPNNSKPFVVKLDAGEEVSKFDFEKYVFSNHLSSHAAECITGIFISLRPGISGHAMLFNVPLALMRTSASSTIISPVLTFSTVTRLKESQQSRKNVGQRTILICAHPISRRRLYANT